ncbi:MAG: hypothetical protein EXR67_06485, partial [Dehalococcoidia bacterium]|nr:hypothetical protein [Dehalococcoidia bacterium]
MTEKQTSFALDTRPTFMVLDGHALVHRAWHAIQNPLTNRRTGEDVRGVYGFIQMFMKAVQDYKPAYLAITFDT